MALITNCHPEHEKHQQHQLERHQQQQKHQNEHEHRQLCSSLHHRKDKSAREVHCVSGNKILNVSPYKTIEPGFCSSQLTIKRRTSKSKIAKATSTATTASSIAVSGNIIHRRSSNNRTSNYVSPFKTVMVTLLISLFVCNLVNLSSSDSPSNSFEQEQQQQQQARQRPAAGSGVNFEGKSLKSASKSSQQQQQQQHQNSDSFVRRTLSPRTVKIKYGSLRGSLIALGTFNPGSNAKVKGYIEIFQGIPYATPPIGSLRFMPPVTPAYWKGTKLCTKFAPVCPQILPRLVLQFNSTSSSSNNNNHNSSNNNNSHNIYNNNNNNYNTHNSNINFNASQSNCLSFIKKFTSHNNIKNSKNQLHSRNKQSNNNSNNNLNSNNYHSKPSNDVNSSKSTSESNVATLCHRQLLLERISSYLNEQSEDCLYLNLFLPYPTSALNGSSEDEGNLAKRRLAVLLLIHGHSLLWGSGNPYDGSILAFSQELIVVTVNYRLGAFGFLSISSADRTRGNFGLFDVIAVLQWIRDNIRAFGGDPDRVTIAGHGLGAEFVNLLLLSPLARGLFSRAILMSGSALNPLLLVKNTTEHSLGLKLNCNSVKSPSECLKSKSTEEIQAAVEASLRNISSSNNHNYLADPFRLLSGVAAFESSNREDNQDSSPGSVSSSSSGSSSTWPTSSVGSSDVSLNGNSFGPIVDGLVIPSNPSHLLKELEISSVGNVNNRSRSIRSTQNESNVHTLLANNSPSNGSFIQVKKQPEQLVSQDNEGQLNASKSSTISSSNLNRPLPWPQPPLVKSLTVTNMTNESTQVSLQIRFSSMSILPIGEMGQIETPMASLISSSIPSVSLPPLKRGPAIGTHDLLLGVNGLNSIDFFTKSEFESGNVNEVKASQWLQSLFPTHPLEVILRALINEPLDMPSDSILATLSSSNSDKRSIGPSSFSSSTSSSSSSSSGSTGGTLSTLNASSTPSRNPSSIDSSSLNFFSSFTGRLNGGGGSGSSSNKSGKSVTSTFNHSTSSSFWLPLVDPSTGEYLVNSLSSFIYNFLTVTPLVNFAKSYSVLSSALNAQASGKVYFYHFSYENKLPLSDFNSESNNDDDSSWFTFNEVNSSSVLFTTTNAKTSGPLRSSPSSSFNLTGQQRLTKHQQHQSAIKLQPRKELYSNGPVRIKDLSVSSPSSSSSTSSPLPSMRRDELFFLFGAPLANSFVPLEYSLSHPNVPFFGSFPLIPLDHTIGADAADDSVDDEKPDDAIIATMVMDQWANFAKFGDPEGEKKEGPPSTSLTKRKKKLPSQSSSSSPSPSSSSSSGSTTTSHQVSQSATIWPAFDIKNQFYLDINLECKIKSHFNSYESSLISNLPTLMMIHENQWHERQLFKLNLLKKSNKSDTHSRSHLLDERSNIINSTIVNVNQLNGNVDDESKVAFFKKFSLKFTDNLRPGLPAVSTSNLGLIYPSGFNNNSLVNSPASGGINNLNNSSSAKTAILLTTEKSELSNTLSLAVVIGVTLFVLNVAVLGGVYCKIHVTRVKTRQQQQQQQQQQQLHSLHPHQQYNLMKESMKHHSSYDLDSDGHCSSVNQVNVSSVNSEYRGGEILDVTTATMAMTELAPDVNRMVDGSTVEAAAVTVLQSLDQSASYVSSRNSAGAAAFGQVTTSTSGGPGGSGGDRLGDAVVSSCTASGSTSTPSCTSGSLGETGVVTLTTTIVPTSMSLASNVSSKKNSSRRNTSNRRVQVVKNCDYPSTVHTYHSSSSSLTKRHHHQHASHLHFQPYINCSDQVTSDADGNELTLDTLYPPNPMGHSTSTNAPSNSSPPSPSPYVNNNSSQLGQMTVSTSILHDAVTSQHPHPYQPSSSHHGQHHQNHVRFSPVISTSDCSPVSSLVSCSSTSQFDSGPVGPSASSNGGHGVTCNSNGSNCHILPPPPSSSLDSSSGGSNITFANSTATNGSYYPGTYSQHQQQQCHHSPYGHGNNNGNGNNNCYLLPSGSSDEADGNNLTSTGAMISGGKGSSVTSGHHQGATLTIGNFSNSSSNNCNNNNNFATDQSSDTSSSGVSSMAMAVVNAVTAKSDVPSSSFMHAVTYDGDNDHNNSFTGITTGHNNSTGKSGSNNRNGIGDSCYSSISRVTDASEFQSQLHFDHEHLINASMDTSGASGGLEGVTGSTVSAGGHGHHLHHLPAPRHLHHHHPHLYTLNTSPGVSSTSPSTDAGEISMQALQSGQLMRNYCHLIPLSNVSMGEMSSSITCHGVNGLAAIDSTAPNMSSVDSQQMNPQVYTVVTSASSQAFNSPSIAPSHLLACQISTQSACEEISPSHHLHSSSSSSSHPHPAPHSHHPHHPCHPAHHSQQQHHHSLGSACSSSSSSSSSSTSSTLSFSSSPSSSNCTECNSHAPVLTSVASGGGGVGSVNSSVNCNSSNSSSKGYKGPNLYSSSSSSLNNPHFHLSTCDTTNGLGVIQEAPDEAHI